MYFILANIRTLSTVSLNHDNTSCLFNLFFIYFLSSPHLISCSSPLLSALSIPCLQSRALFPASLFSPTSWRLFCLLHFSSISKISLPSWQFAFPKPIPVEKFAIPTSHVHLLFPPLSLWLSLSWNRHQRFPHITQPSRTLLFAWGSLRAPHSQLLF